MRTAAEFRWQNPGASWDEVAAAAGVSRSTMTRMRRLEQWEIEFREAGNAYIEKLAPLAVESLVTAWSKSNPSGAIEVLRSFGFLRPDRLEIAAEIGAAEGALIADAIRAVVFDVSLDLGQEQREALLERIAERLPS